MTHYSKFFVWRWQTAVWLVVAMFRLLFVGTGTAVAQVTPIDFQDFTGVGLTPDATLAGSLDSNLWSVTGMSDGDCDFGSTCTSGDFARGANIGSATTGGLYAFTNVGVSGNTILGVQPVGSDFTPGQLILRIPNNTGATIDDIYIAYDIWYLNNQPRANSLNFSYAIGEGIPTTVPSFNFITPEAATVSTPIEPEDWESVSRSATFEEVNWPDGQYLYLIWTGDDETGSGARDKYGLSNIEVRVGGPTAVSLANIGVNTAVPTGLLLILLVVVGTAVCLLTMRRYQNN